MLKNFTKNNRAIEFRKCIGIKTMERNQTFNQDHWIRKDKGVSLSAAKKNNLEIVIANLILPQSTSLGEECSSTLKKLLIDIHKSLKNHSVTIG